MTTCSGCGKHIDHAHYHNGVPYCSICVSLIQTSEGQCANCGMYLPITEMKMWASRYYCNYCIMDIMDEEERMKKAGKKTTEHHAHDELEKSESVIKREIHGHASHETGDKRIPKQCQICGRQVDFLYNVSGRLLCEFCKDDFGGKPDTHHGMPHGLLFILNSIKNKVSDQVSKSNKKNNQTEEKKQILEKENNKDLKNRMNKIDDKNKQTKRMRIEEMLKRLKKEREDLKKTNNKKE